MNPAIEQMIVALGNIHPEDHNTPAHVSLPVETAKVIAMKLHRMEMRLDGYPASDPPPEFITVRGLWTNGDKWDIQYRDGAWCYTSGHACSPPKLWMAMPFEDLRPASQKRGGTP